MTNWPYKQKIKIYCQDQETFDLLIDYLLRHYGFSFNTYFRHYYKYIHITPEGRLTHSDDGNGIDGGILIDIKDIINTTKSIWDD